MCCLRAIGLIFLLVSISGLAWMLSVIFDSKGNRNFVLPELALQFVWSPEDVKRVLDTLKEQGQSDPNEFFRKRLKLDSYGLIPFYWTALTALSIRLFRRQFQFAKWLGVAAALCVTAAAAFDYLENHRIRQALGDHQLAAGIRQASLCKWGLLFTVAGLLSSLLLSRRDWGITIGALYLLGALIGLAGLWQHRLIDWSLTLMLLAGVGLGTLLVFAPEQLADKVQGLPHG